MSDVREDAREKAQRLGLDLVLPGPSEIFVDLDSLDELSVFMDRFETLQRVYPEATKRVRKSQSAGHFHVVVDIQDLAPLGEHERIALQAALGSDPMREILAIHHAREGYEFTSVFFEPKAEAA